MTDDNYKQQVKEQLLADDLVRAVFSGRQRGHEGRYERAVVRPVQVKGRRQLQVSLFDAQKDYTTNYDAPEQQRAADELLAMPFKNIHVQTGVGEMQVNISKKGRPVVSGHKARDVPAPIDLSHNRVKQRILGEPSAAPFLKAVGIMTAEGAIRADMQRKYRQIDQFLQLVEQTGVFDGWDRPDVRVADLGCGNAYLTFATYYYLSTVRGLRPQITGVDRKGELLVELREHARALEADIHFEDGRIADYAPDVPPDVVLALHACDTATDDALAQGIGWGSPLLVAAPCCQHELQVQLDRAPTPAPFAGVMRYGILSERTGDILTDAFRAQILGIMGYRTDVVQFASTEHTAKNLLIRAVRAPGFANPRLLEEYRAMKEFWGVTPYLERLLGERFVG
ncbi:MAG: SAM-dependent methyltransferase [Chloroflexales bacterium]|nr:SAM-dependent methyltransferase [Chloroflexales bacterium]